MSLNGDFLVPSHVISGPVIHLNAKMGTNTRRWRDPFLNSFFKLLSRNWVSLSNPQHAQSSCLQICRGAPRLPWIHTELTMKPKQTPYAGAGTVSPVRDVY
jgi:hypothetical protein